MAKAMGLAGPPMAAVAVAVAVAAAVRVGAIVAEK